MPGSQRNEWNSYLNGGTPHYNFSYRDEIPLPEPTVPLQPVSPPIPSKPIQVPTLPPSSMTPVVNKKKQKGGKRKTRRHTKKRRYSRRK
jgi:hypothetical protein